MLILAYLIGTTALAVAIWQRRTALSDARARLAAMKRRHDLNSPSVQP